MNNWKEKLTKILNSTGMTDSDLEDFAHDNNISIKEVFEYVTYLKIVGTPCEGCKNALLGMMGPCVVCSRNKKDYYKSINET